jgi:predicted aspartyl protease
MQKHIRTAALAAAMLGRLVVPAVGGTVFSIGDDGGIEVFAFLGDRDGDGPVRMCVDTGASTTTINYDTASYLLSTKQARLSDDVHMVLADGTERVAQTIIIATMGMQDGAGMVGWATDNVRAVVVPRSPSSGTVGCLGLNYIGLFSHFYFNWRNHTIDAKP